MLTAKNCGEVHTSLLGAGAPAALGQHKVVHHARPVGRHIHDRLNGAVAGRGGHHGVLAGRQGAGVEPGTFRCVEGDGGAVGVAVLYEEGGCQRVVVAGGGDGTADACTNGVWMGVALI